MKRVSRNIEAEALTSLKLRHQFAVIRILETFRSLHRRSDRSLCEKIPQGSILSVLCLERKLQVNLAVINYKFSNKTDQL